MFTIYKWKMWGKKETFFKHTYIHKLRVRFAKIEHFSINLKIKSQIVSNKQMENVRKSETFFRHINTNYVRHLHSCNNSHLLKLSILENFSWKKLIIACMHFKAFKDAGLHYLITEIFDNHCTNVKLSGER